MAIETDGVIYKRVDCRRENMDLGDIDNFFFDLDQTLWNWDTTILGAEDLIHTLGQKDKNVRFFTDNTLFSSEGYARKLRSMDIDAQSDDIMTVNHVVGRYFNRRDIHSVYIIGGSRMINGLDKHDISVSHSADNVLLGLDNQFNYRKLKRAAEILKNGGKLYTCSREKQLKKSGETRPHQLALNRALETFTDDVKLLGKPSDEYVNEFTNYFSFLPDNSMLIGDQLDDIEMGNKLGMKTALVMSGGTRKSDIQEAESIREPDYGVSNLSKLTRRLKK